MFKKFYDYILDFIIVEAIFRFHRELQIGNVMNISEVIEQQPQVLPDQTTKDIFGLESNTNAKRQMECTCTCFVCNRIIAASRFAPHLEKCIGHGRTTRSRTRRKVDGIDPTKFIINHDGTARPIRYHSRSKIILQSDGDVDVANFQVPTNQQKIDCRPKRYIPHTYYTQK